MDVTSLGNKLWTIIVGMIVALLSLVSAGAATADESTEDVENFRYTSWDLDYQLSTDDQGRAQAEVTETLEAEFPETDQNRGIVRSLPLQYQGAPAAPENIRVTDANGAEVPFEIENDDGFRSVLVGDDSFVHGSQTYVISYTLDDVMHATEYTDEFYWDIVPVDRQQDIDDVTAEVTLGPTLSSATTGASACYRGTPDDSQACSLETADDGSSFSVTESQLAAGDGLTVAIGVEPGTVVQPPERQDNFLLDVVPLLLVGASVLLAAGGGIAVLRMVNRYRDDTTQTSTQLGIPEDMNPLLAKWVTGRGDNPVVATILDLAVRGVVRIEEREETTGWRKKKTEQQPVLRLLDPTLVTDPLETELLEGIFPGTESDATFDFPKDSKVFTKAAQKVMQDSGKAVLERGYQQKVRHSGAALVGWIALGLLIPTVILVIMGASRDTTVMVASTIALGALSLMLFFACVVRHRVLTPRGAAARRQLESLRQIIKASEADRLDMLQSFDHADRRPTPDEDADGEIIHLYDRLLPYAVLFGMQKDWAQILASAYQHHHLMAPIWYPALFNQGAGGAQDSLSSMLSSVSSAAATSSSGAGATGAGVAGGGGGGGAAGGR